MIMVSFGAKVEVGSPLQKAMEGGHLSTGGRGAPGTLAPVVALVGEPGIGSYHHQALANGWPLQ